MIFKYHEMQISLIRKMQIKLHLDTISHMLDWQKSQRKVHSWCGYKEISLVVNNVNLYSPYGQQLAFIL